MLDKYFPFTGENFKISMGVRPLHLDDWIEFADDREFQLAEKRRLLRDERLRVLRGSVSGPALEAAYELRELVQQRVALAATEEPLVDVSLVTQEDWALLSAVPPVTLELACICFPSRWSLELKIGRASDEIHAPVPSFSTIAKPTQNFLERIQPDKPMWRLNWSIHDSDRLFTPGPHPSEPGIVEENVLDKTFLRLEKQTLRKLPRTGFVAFSIRTFTHRMRDVVATPERLRLTLASLEKVDAETISYRGMAAFHSTLVATLRNAT